MYSNRPKSGHVALSFAIVAALNLAWLALVVAVIVLVVKALT